jgi:hypothetical protein
VTSIQRALAINEIRISRGEEMTGRKVAGRIGRTVIDGYVASASRSLHEIHNSLGEFLASALYFPSFRRVRSENVDLPISPSENIHVGSIDLERRDGGRDAEFQALADQLYFEAAPSQAQPFTEPRPLIVFGILHLAVVDVTAALSDIGQLHLDSMNFSAATDGAGGEARAKGLDVPVRAFGSIAAKTFGRQVRVTLDGALGFHWETGAQRLSIEPARLEISGLGTLDASASFGNLPSDVLDHPDVLNDATFHRLELRISNSGSMDEVFDNLAGLLGISRSVLASGLKAKGEELGVGVLGDPIEAKAVAQALSEFLTAPRNLFLTLTADPPVSFETFKLLRDHGAPALPLSKGVMRVEAVAHVGPAQVAPPQPTPSERTP